MLPEEPLRPALPAADGVHLAATAGVSHPALPVPGPGSVAILPPARLASPPVAFVPRETLRRIPVTLDPISAGASGLTSTLDPFRLAASTRVFGGLQQIKHHSDLILDALAARKLPSKLIGVVHQPDGSGAARVQLQLPPESVGAKGAPVTVLTGDDGGFILVPPPGAQVPPQGLSLTVHGAHGNQTLTVSSSQIAANGVLGVLLLAEYLAPLPVSIMAALRALTPSGPSAAPPPSAAAPPRHVVTLGERDSQCQQTFVKGQSTDRFPWSLFFRIVEPQLSVVTHARAVPLSATGHGWLPVYQNDGSAQVAATVAIDRRPVDQPLSVDGFRDQLAGIDGSGYFTADETVPMAASLGLGYVLRLAQHWTFTGLGLGDLIYSLPLAPGEQQQIAVFERKDTMGVTETESFSQQQGEEQTAHSDTSTTATFHQSFAEMVQGHSDFSTTSVSASTGFSFGFGPIALGGGGGASTGSGNDNTSLSGSRDTCAQATQATHSSAENTAAAHLQANRTGMRLASGSEDMSTTTKTITNHNHAHALTMQYWEVVRMYDVSTTIEGVSLVCLVPMQVVRFMPPGQPVTLTDPGVVDSPAKVTERYKYILRHLDVLQAAVPAPFRRGLDLLAQFAADPTTVVDGSNAAAETVIRLTVTGSFLSCERIYVSAVTKRNTRVGPVRLTPVTAGQPAAIPSSQFQSREELTGWLTAQRQSSQSTLQASLALPAWMSRSDIVGFEVTRQFTSVVHTLTSPAQQAVQLLLQAGESVLGPVLGDIVKPGGLTPPLTVTLGTAELEQLLSGPSLASFSASIENAAGQPAAGESYANDNFGGAVLPTGPFPVPAQQLAPVLRFQDVLDIERSVQHIVRNTARYSRVLWLSMTPDETAMLLDGHTIGVPAGGLADASQMIPLMNCVQNTILGTYGNSLIMPFTVPQELADTAQLHPGELQQALLDYQSEAFESPTSTIALPTRGVVGEAVLGSCTSAEKIDITRFWNWQDAPADTAPGIGMVQLPTTTPPLTTGVTAPNSLTNLPPLINNLITAPQPNTGLLQAMGQQASSQPDFSQALTGQQELSSQLNTGQTLANQARADALKTSQTLASQGISVMADLAKSAMNLPAGGGGTPGTPAPGAPATPGKQPATQQPGQKQPGQKQPATQQPGQKQPGQKQPGQKQATTPPANQPPSDPQTPATPAADPATPAADPATPAADPAPSGGAQLPADAGATDLAGQGSDVGSFVSEVLPVVEEAAPIIAALF